MPLRDNIMLRPSPFVDLATLPWLALPLGLMNCSTTCPCPTHWVWLKNLVVPFSEIMSCWDLHHLLILPLYHGTVGTATLTDESLNHLLISHPFSMIEELGFIIEWNYFIFRPSPSIHLPTLTCLAFTLHVIEMPPIFCVCGVMRKNWLEFSLAGDQSCYLFPCD